MTAAQEQKKLNGFLAQLHTFRSGRTQDLMKQFQSLKESRKIQYPLLKDYFHLLPLTFTTFTIKKLARRYDSIFLLAGGCLGMFQAECPSVS